MLACFYYKMVAIDVFSLKWVMLLTEQKHFVRKKGQHRG